MTKVKSIILAALVMFNIHLSYAQYGTGAVFNPKIKSGAEMKTSGMGFSSEVPASYSMKMYAPYAKSQGIYSSCAGWAVSYEALSIQYAIANGITDRNHITAKAFCPYYSYNKEQPEDPNCNKGAYAGSMMTTLKNDGGKKFYLPVLGCGSTVADEFTYASQYYKIKEWYTLKNVWPEEVTYDGTDVKGSFKKFFEAPHQMNIADVKKLLANNYPIVVNMALPTSFYSAGEFWEPTAEEKADPSAAIMDNTGAHRFHCMTVVGFDDNKFGGAFEVMNSWSESWGNNGFFWVKYEDFKTYVYAALLMDIFPVESSMSSITGAVWGDCVNGYGFCRFSNGQTYEGQFMDGTYNGYGVYTWPNGQTYAGQWKKGKRDGEATCYFVGGTFGQATYANDIFVSGYNELSGTNGESYKGYLKDGNYEGYGEYRFATGEKYIGMWSAGSLNGLVKHFAVNGTTFIGYYTDGKRNGKGLEVSSSGRISAGEWSYGVYQSGKTFGFAGGMSGKAGAEMSSNLYLSADCIFGNCLMGEGKRVTGNGNSYAGTFVDGLEDGKGAMIYSDHSYDGSWKQGKYHGIGETKYTNGFAYISEYKKGQLDGYILKFDNSGKMGVDLFSQGILVTSYTELSASPSAGAGMKPGAFAPVPSKVSAIK